MSTPPSISSNEQVHVEPVTASHVKVFTSIEIDAPHELVWDTVTDFERIGEWSTTLVKVVGDFHADGVIRTTFRLGMGMQQTPSHQLIYFEEGHQFGWSDPMFFGIRDNHKYIVEPLPNGRSRFIQTDGLTGGLTFMLGRVFAKQFAAMFKTFNQELKQEVERRQASLV